MNTKKLPCPYCRGKAFVDLAPAAAVHLETVDVQILRTIWQFMAIHHGPPSPDDISEMLPSVTPRVVAHRLKKLRSKGYLSSRGGLRMVPNLAHFLDWNIVLPDESQIVLGLMDAPNNPSPLSMRDLLKKHGTKIKNS